MELYDPEIYLPLFREHRVNIIYKIEQILKPKGIPLGRRNAGLWSISNLSEENGPKEGRTTAETWDQEALVIETWEDDILDILGCYE